MRKKWVIWKENLLRNNLKQQYTPTEWKLKQICATINCELEIGSGRNTKKKKPPSIKKRARDTK